MGVRVVTREEFIEAYCARSGVSWDWLSEVRKAVLCECGDESCEGWAMVPLDWETWDGRKHELSTTPCRGCGARVVWAQTVNGKAIPLNSSPDPAGNLVLETANRDRSGARRAVYVRPGERAGEPRYTSHFATCPKAERFRQRAV